MPRKPQIPYYRLHKPSGQARVIIDGRHVYLGLHGSPESREKYARLIAERVVPAEGNSAAPFARGHFADITINELLLRYWEFATTYYVQNGRPTKEQSCMRDAIRPLRLLYSHSLARDFGPLALKAVRQHMVGLGWARSLINSRVNRIKRVFKWAVSEELVPPSVHEGLRTVRRAAVRPNPGPRS